MIRFLVALAISSAAFIPTASASKLDSLLSATPGYFAVPEAANRRGSKRVGGYSSSGKGSRYVGGQKRSTRKK